MPPLTAASALGRPLVITLGLPKTGTTSISEYFNCSGWSTSHWNCGASGKCGLCLLDFVQRVASQEHSGSRGWRERPDRAPELLSACGRYDVFGQLDYQAHSACIYPQVSHLHTLLRALPRACFVLNTRPLGRWIESVRRWGLKELHSTGARYEPERDTLLAKMLSSCPILPRNESGLLEWHARHLERARDALRGHPCALEFDIEDPLAGRKLQAAFRGTNAACWQQHNVNTMVLSTQQRHAAEAAGLVGLAGLAGLAGVAGVADL